MGRLSEKVAIITGAAGGQGAAEARLFPREGASVIATDLQKELLEQVVMTSRTTGDRQSPSNRTSPTKNNGKLSYNKA